MFGILRTVLAFNVVLLHIFSVPTLGNYSVSFFFVLSGFLMTYIMNKKYGYSVEGIKIFWFNRALRLYPLYFVVIGITILLILLFPDVVTHPHIFIPNGVKEWFSNITLIFPKIVPHRFTPRLSPPTWALTNELFYYLLISIGISRTFKRSILWLILSVGYFIGTYLFYDIATYRYSAIPSSSLPFALGACLYWVNNRYSNVEFNFLRPIFIFLLFLLNALLSNSYGLVFKEISIYINYLLAVLMIYLLFNIKVNDKFKKVDNYIGLYSYPIYISHYAVGILFTVIFGFGTIKNNFKLMPKAFIFYSLLLMLFCSILVHLIDVNINKIKKNIKLNKPTIQKKS